MKNFKTIVLGILLVIVVVTIYFNNLSVKVSNPPENYKECSQFYYHPQVTYIPQYRSSPVNDMFWITTDGQVVNELIAMPGMKVSLSHSNNNVYSLVYSDTASGGVEREVTKQEAEFLTNSIPGLELNGKKIEVSDYIGYIDDQLTKIIPQKMLGNASGCKEQK